MLCAAVFGLSSGCAKVSVNLEGFACDRGRCAPGYTCDEMTQTCVSAGSTTCEGVGCRDGDTEGDPSDDEGDEFRPAGEARSGDATAGGDGQQAGDATGTCGWWSASYLYRRAITITNNATSKMPSGYSVVVSLDHGSLVPNKSRSDGNDLRIATCDGLQLDRIDASPITSGSATSSFNGSTTRLFFKTNGPLAAGASDTYFLYYGYGSAGSPPADPGAVFDFWEPFDDIDAWTVIGTPGASVGEGVLAVDDLKPGDLLYITGTAGDRSGDSGFAVRTRALQLNLGNDLGPVGWHYDTSSGRRYDISASGSVNRIRYWGIANDVTATLFGDGGSAIPSLSTWYVYEATVEGSDFTFARDDSTVGTASDSQLSNGKVHINGECLSAQWDWLLIRHFVSTEPTVSLGEERIP